MCRIDVRRSFGVKTRNIQSALEVAMDYMRRHPREKVELYFRRGTYLINSGNRPSLWLRHFKPENNGRLIIAGAGEAFHLCNELRF